MQSSNLEAEPTPFLDDEPINEDVTPPVTTQPSVSLGTIPPSNPNPSYTLARSQSVVQPKVVEANEEKDKAKPKQETVSRKRERTKKSRNTRNTKKRKIDSSDTAAKTQPEGDKTQESTSNQGVLTNDEYVPTH